jgi:hypothetical protein
MENQFQQLIQMVHETRVAQNQYFRVKTQTNLAKAKALETQLDRFVAQHYSETPKTPQPTQKPLL